MANMPFALHHASAQYFPGYPKAAMPNSISSSQLYDKAYEPQLPMYHQPMQNQFMTPPPAMPNHFNSYTEFPQTELNVGSSSVLTQSDHETNFDDDPFCLPPIDMFDDYPGGNDDPFADWN